MAEKLPDVVLSEDEDMTDQQTSLNGEIRKCISDLKEKVKKDKEECRQFLDAASHVKKEEDESLYRNLFGMMVKDCVLCGCNPKEGSVVYYHGDDGI